MLSIEQAAIVTKPGEHPPYSPHGYCIMPDGTCYTLLRQWWHGALLALLFPEQAKEAGYELPDHPDDVNVYEFQRFELDNHNLFPVIRICPGRVMGPTSVDRGCDPSTPEQIATVLLIMKELGMEGNDTVATDSKDMKVREMIDFLVSNAEVWGGGERRVTKHRLIKKGEDAMSVLDEAQDAEIAAEVAANPDKYVATLDDDGTGDWLPQSFEQAAGITKRQNGRNDE